MQLSKPFVLPYLDDVSGFRVFRMMAYVGTEQLSYDILSLIPNTELNGRTAQQIAYEGIASAVIRGRNKEDSHSSPARTVETVKTMATVMNALRKKWMSYDIRYVHEEPYTMDEMLAFSMQAIEGMTVDALQIQAGLAEKEAPYPLCPRVWNNLANTKGAIEPNRPLAASFPLEKWLELCTTNINDATLMVSAIVQFRDPMKQYEKVGGPLVVLIEAIPTRATHAKDGDEVMYKLNELYVRGLNLFNGGIWNAEKQHLTAKQWLVAHGLGKAGKVCKLVQEKADEVIEALRLTHPFG
ncbi:hypothetical protein IFM89_023350 [Coptis chinensis]|uniref:PMI1/PMIR1-2 C-terminal domain-containing protein n=1 Tax=Coptis chinensis TaxID=261450 RepID=A0A835HNW2_9MAGN|nr:hypothetical protein IFM89_023350 [Coptis chinensis]